MVATVFAQVYPTGMVSYWKFDEGSGTIASDSAGSNDGTLINGPVWTTGIVGGALSFDGVDDRVSISDDSSLKFTSAMTLEAWINTPLTAGMANGGRIFDKSDSSFSAGYALNVDSSGNIIFNTKGIDWSTVAYSVITANNWHHIVATYDGSAKKIYVDGVEKASEGTTGSISTSNDDLWIGYLHYSITTDRMFNGLIDEAAVYNGALTPEEIQQHYQNGLNGLGYEALVAVTIDIKPGSDPNSINPNGKGVIPVAILSTPTFDATTVDASTVTFGPGAATMVHENAHLEDVDGDGDIDMVLHFKTQDTGIQAGDTEAALTGATVGGQLFEGTDSVQTVGKP